MIQQVINQAAIDLKKDYDIVRRNLSPQCWPGLSPEVREAVVSEFRRLMDSDLGSDLKARLWADYHHVNPND